MLRPAFGKTTLGVLAYLLLNRGAPQRRDDVAFALWPDDLESEARANLRRQLYLIARALPTVAQPWIVADTRSIAWNFEAPLELDVERFERYASDPTTRTRALDLYVGDLLADLEAEWLDARRRRLRERFCEVALEAAREATVLLDHARAVGLAQRVLEVDPWREEALRIVVAGRASAGDRASALAEYLDFEKRLRDELDAQPMPETRELYDRLAGGSLVASALPAQETVRSRTVPGHLSRFIGRESEAATVATALESSRLVTLLGAGGVGKSRLAAHVADAHSVRSTFSGEPIFIELAAVTNDRTSFETKIRDALGIDAGDESVVDAVARVAGSRRYLIILDNAEHLVEVAGRFLVELFARSGAVTALTTSRQPFHIQGEQIVGLRPLRVPEREAKLDEALASEAVVLFLDRAKSLDVDFRFAAADAKHIAAIARRLDGIPLAIELAAARTNVLTVREIDERLSDRFTLLKTRRMDALHHHQTLRATLDWSFDLLEERERRSFRRLAVFKNGWTLDAAAEVVTLGGKEPIDALESLTRLIDQSLVIVHDGHGERRYDYLDTIRAYALMRLSDSGEEASSRIAAGDYFARYVDARRADFGSAHEKAAFDAVAIEHDNILGVIDESIGRGNAMAAARIAASLAPFWVTRGFALEARRRIETLLGVDSELDLAVRGRLGNVASILHYRCGDIARSLERANEALALASTSGDDRAMADALVGQARCWFSSDDFGAATAALQRAGAIYERIGDRLEIARTFNFMGMLAEGDVARDLHERSLAIYEERGHMEGIATVNYHLGYRAYVRGEHEDAIVYATKALEIWHESANLQGENWAQYNIACAEAALGRYERSTSRFLTCIVTAHRYGFGRDLCDGLERLAGLIAEYAPDASARAMGHAKGLRDSYGHAMLANERPGYERVYARVAGLLGAETFAAAWQAGRSLESGTLIESIATLLNLRLRMPGRPQAPSESIG